MNTTLEQMRAPMLSDDAPIVPSSKELTNGEAAALVAVALVHFVFAHGPIWNHPWSPNASIVYSYLPIPFLVALVLRRGRRLSASSWMLGTLQVATFKFVLSAGLLIALWAITNPPPVIPSMQHPPSSPAVQAVATRGNDAPPVAVTLGRGPTPAIELSAGGQLLVQSGDGRMHTLQAPSLGLAVPVVGGGVRAVRFVEPGTFDLACAVHPDEPRVHLTVR